MNAFWTFLFLLIWLVLGIFFTRISWINTRKYYDGYQDCPFLPYFIAFGWFIFLVVGIVMILILAVIT